MANITYTTLHPVTAQTRAQAYAIAADMLLHLVGMNCDLVSIVVNPNKTVSVTLTAPLRADHAGFWDMDGGV